jgi:hypothetical protein
MNIEHFVLWKVPKALVSRLHSVYYIDGHIDGTG